MKRYGKWIDKDDRKKLFRGDGSKDGIIWDKDRRRLRGGPGSLPI